MLCGNLFSQFQQGIECLLFVGLFNQLRQKHTENIGAVMPGRCGNLVDEVMQFFDSNIGWLGFCKKIGQIADKRVGRIIIDNFNIFILDLLIFFKGKCTFFCLVSCGKRCNSLEK